MPKVRPLIRPDPRETELLGEIGRLQAMSGKSYRYLCDRAGLEYKTFMAHKANVKQMRYSEFWKFADVCRKEGGAI